MAEPTPTAEQLQASLERLNEQLVGLSAARPSQRSALQQLDTNHQ